MAVNKVIYNGNTLVDMTGDTVTAETLAEGATAHAANGERVVGTMTAVQYGKAQSLNNTQKAQARTNIGAASALELSQFSATVDAIGTQEEIVQQVIAALGTPVFGRIDEDCKITLTGELADGKTYTFVYEDEDGNENTIGSYTKTTVPTYTNVLPLATDKTGAVYNSTGYKIGARIGSSGSEGTVSNTSATNPIFLTGYIQVPAGATIRMKGCFIDTNGVQGTINNTADKAYYGHDLAGLYGCIVYNTLAQTNFNDNTTNYQWNGFVNYSLLASEPTVDSNGYVTEFTLNTTETKYIRMHLGGDPTTAVITINEPITD